MVFLPELIDQINTALGFRFKKYPLALYKGLVTQGVINIDNNVVSFPSVISNAGVAEEVSYDIRYPFIVYHRALVSNFQPGTQKGYGDGDLLNITCSTTVRLVCTGNRADIAVSPEEFAMMICDSLPTGAKATKLKYVKISPNNILYDAQTVFANEFKGLGFNIGPERFLFSIQYTIEGGYIKGCLNTCDC